MDAAEDDHQDQREHHAEQEPDPLPHEQLQLSDGEQTQRGTMGGGWRRRAHE
jgi:hypothetical protein